MIKLPPKLSDKELAQGYSRCGHIVLKFKKSGKEYIARGKDDYFYEDSKLIIRRGKDDQLVIIRKIILLMWQVRKLFVAFFLLYLSAAY